MSRLADALRETFLSPAPGPIPELRSATGTLSEPPDWLWNALGASAAFGGERITPEIALRMDAVYASVSLLAGQVATMPLPVYRGVGGSRERLYGDRRYRLLHDAPNPETAPDVFRELLMAHVLLWGDAFLEKVRSRSSGAVVELWPVVPAGVEVLRDETKPDRPKRFRIPGVEGTLGEDAILHIPGFGYDGLRGRSVISLARDSFSTARARERYEGRFYENDATPGGVLSVQGELSPEAAARLREQWEAAHRGASNRGRIAVLEAGAEWQSIGLPLKDQEYVARSTASVAQVARWFGVPPELIGGSRQGSSMTYSTVEGQALQFLTFTLNRWLVRLEQGFRRDPDLFPEPNVYPEFTREAVLRLDAKARAEFYEIMHRIGALSPNEIRERENMTRRTDPGGDAFVSTLPGAPVEGEGGGEGEGDGAPAPEPDDAERRRLELAGLMGLAAQRMALAVRGGVLSQEESRAPLGLTGEPPPAPAGVPTADEDEPGDGGEGADGADPEGVPTGASSNGNGAGV